jgi:hypothetical protein
MPILAKARGAVAPLAGSSDLLLGFREEGGHLMAKLSRMRNRVALGSLLFLTFVLAQCQSPGGSKPAEIIGSGGLRMGMDRQTGLPSAIISKVDGRERAWLFGPTRLTVKGEASQKQEPVLGGRVLIKKDTVEVSTKLASLGLSLSHRLQVFENRAVWEMTFSSAGMRTGHEVGLELPLVFPEAQIFTPSQYGVMDVAAYPTFQPVAYARYAWKDGQSYVLPLVSIMDPGSDSALTVALPADANIPHFQVAWSDARVLTLRMGHRGVGGGRPTNLRLLFYVHPADYRSALKAYSDDFPAHFHPPLPRGPYEGTFWYHHILDHPDFEEMARQHVRYIWTSFWFTHMGEFLPEAKEWYPYSYSRWWKLKRKMSDDTINSFIRKMHGRGIGTYAYFNLTEFGGAGGEQGDTADADRFLNRWLSPALVRDAESKFIPTWEEAKVINPGRDYPYRSVLMEQVRRHLERLPDLDGFAVDRLDWTSAFDYGHDDGLSMDGDRPMENLAVPVADALAELCRLAHEAGKRVLVNQFWRVEVVRDADGYCHENDYLPALAYLAPFRPASAWQMRQEYSGDLLPFEAQMKRRLHWALFPQLVTHEFPVSQQPPNRRAADFMELFAPLFEPLMGKEQVLLPHCVAVSGPNEVNLFRNGRGHYVAPVTSRVRFLCRPPRVLEPAELTLQVPDAAEISWAHVYSADVPPYRGVVKIREGAAVISLEDHGTSSLVVAGRSPEPQLEDADSERLSDIRARHFAAGEKKAPAPGRPEVEGISEVSLEISGAPIGASSPSTVIDVLIDGQKAGEMIDAQSSFRMVSETPALPERPPVVSLVPGDEGTWLVPEKVELIVRTGDGRKFRAASWETGDICGAERFRGLRLPLSWRKRVT